MLGITIFHLIPLKAELICTRSKSHLSFCAVSIDVPMFWLQPLVPTVAAADGRWMVSEPLTVVLKPGGHGVIWKLASDDGVFDWLSTQGRKAAIVRQIRYASRTSTT